MLAAHERADGILEGDVAEAAAFSLGEQRRGETIGPYRIIQRLGRGGMGDVYLAVREQPFKRFVALKLMRQGMDTPEALERFTVERQIMASLSHPNIAQLLDGGITNDGLPFLAMEYVEGLPITAFCDRNRLGIEDRLKLFETVCAAVQHAHRNLVIHRDLKPANILITAAGQVKLLDFGIAKLLNPTLSSALTPVTRTGFRVMTPEYASPEQIRGEPLTTSTDIYSLGVVLYELLTGHRPYRLRDSPAHEVLRAVCEQDPERPSTAVSRSEQTSGEGGGKIEVTPETVSAARELSPERLQRRLRGDLDNIALLTLRKEPDRRYGSAEQLALELQRFREGLPVQARGEGRRYRLGKFVRRHRIETVAVGLVVLSLVAGLGLALWQTNETSRAREGAEQALVESEQVRAFLVSLFSAENPREGREAAITLSELLAVGVERAEQLGNQPVLQAEVLAAIGQVYLQREEFAQAEALFRRVVQARRQSLGERDPAVAEALVRLGDGIRGQGRYSEAESLYREGLRIQDQARGGSDAARAVTLARLGSARTYHGDIESAEALFRSSLALRRSALGPDDPSVPEAMRLVAATLRRQGKYDEAAASYREALALQQRIHGPQSVEAAFAMLHLGSQHFYMGRPEEAEPLFREGHRILRTALGADHPDLVQGLHSLATLLEARRDFAQAEVVRREAVALARRAYGDGNWHVADEMDDLGAHFRRRGRFDEAEALHRQAIAIYDGTSLPSRRHAIHTRVGLAELYLARGEYKKAEAIFREVLARCLAEEPPGGGLPALDMERLADALVPQREYAEADILYHRALGIFQPQTSDRHHDVQRLLRKLAKLYELQHRPQAAAPYQARVMTEGVWISDG